MPFIHSSRVAVVFALVMFAFGPLAITPSASIDCGSPAITVSNGAKPAADGVFVVYKGQIVTIRGTGWSSCTERVGGCIEPSRPAPVSRVELSLVRATTPRTTAPPSSWQLTTRVIELGEVQAGDDYSFDMDQVTMPAHHGHFVLTATADLARRAVAYLMVL